jgi:hypothetical protein
MSQPEPLTSLSQHYLVEVLLELEQPFTAQDVVDEIASGPASQTVSVPSMKQRLNTLVRLGWVTKGPGPKTGRRGKPTHEYAMVAGARAAWSKRDEAIQRGLEEQRRHDEALLG